MQCGCKSRVVSRLEDRPTEVESSVSARLGVEVGLHPSAIDFVELRLRFGLNFCVHGICFDLTLSFIRARTEPSFGFRVGLRDFGLHCRFDRTTANRRTLAAAADAFLASHHHLLVLVPAIGVGHVILNISHACGR